MKFGTVRHDGRDLAVVVSGDGAAVHGLDQDLETLVPQGLGALLAAGRRAREGGIGIPLAEVAIRPPFRPASVRDFVTFEQHVVGVRKSVDGANGVPPQWYAAPTFYFTNPHAIYGHGEDIPRPDRCRRLDFELEVAAVVGRECRSVSQMQARDAIVGYTIFNDWSARDLQSAEMTVGLGPAKGKDFASSLGPWLVTADEVDEHRDADGFLTLACSVTVNGVEVGRDSLAHMGWTFETMLAYAARDSVVKPLDVLASGTTGGGGCLAELWGRRGIPDPPPLEPGDEVTITVERLGSLTNRVVAGSPTPEVTAFRPPPAR